jgi:histidine triad (HIT) family protein
MRNRLKLLTVLSIASAIITQQNKIFAMFNDEAYEESRDSTTPISRHLHLNLNNVQSNGQLASPLSPVFSKRQSCQLQHISTDRHDEKCLFCKFATGTVRTSALSKSDNFFLLNDAFPKAPIHQLWIPFEHIIDISDMKLNCDNCQANDQALAIDFFTTLRDFSKTQKNFTVYGNNGESAGQTIPHLHFHITSGGNVLGNGKFKRLMKNEIIAEATLPYGNSENTVIHSSDYVSIVKAQDNIAISKNGSPRSEEINNNVQNSSNSFSALHFDNESMNGLFETEVKPSHYIIIPVDSKTSEPLMKTISEFNETIAEHREAAISTFNSIQRLSLDLGVEGFNIVTLYNEDSRMFCLHFVSGKGIHAT